MACTLCGSATLTAVASVNPADIARLYRQDFGLHLPALAAAGPRTPLVLWLCPGCGLKQFSPAWSGPARLYEALQDFPWYYQEEKAEFNVAQTLLKAGDRVLEVGCGRGGFASGLDVSVRYVGLEMNPQAMQAARARGLDVRSDALEDFVEQQRGVFDMACAFQVLEHVPQPGAFLRQMVALLKPGGRLVVSVPGDDSFVGTEVNNVLNLPPHHLTRWSDHCLLALPQRLGLRLLHLRHEPLSAGHVRAVAVSWVWRAIHSATREAQQPLLMGASHPRLRRCALAASVPLRAWARASAPRLRGHTSTLVMQKDESDRQG
jgi:SAM-dependent methyltransferase